MAIQETVQFVPGVVVSPAAITLPAAASRIDRVISAYILRPRAALADHAAADVVAALADHPAADVAAGIADHAAHGHDMTMAAAAGGGSAVTAPAVAGPLESAGGVATMVGAVDALAAAQAHAAGAADVAHAAGAAAVTHGVAANPVVAAVPTKLTDGTFSLSVNTEAGDIVSLSYIPQGGALCT